MAKTLRKPSQTPVKAPESPEQSPEAPEGQNEVSEPQKAVLEVQDKPEPEEATELPSALELARKNGRVD